MKHETATVLGLTPMGGNVFRVELEAPSIAASAVPGQFINIFFDQPGAFFLPRPISILDASGSRILILFRAAGAGTTLMADWRAGDRVRLLGPLGGRLVLPENTGRIVLAAGGIGLPPLHFLLKRSLEKNSRFPPVEAVFYGAATAADLHLADNLEKLIPSRVHLTTEDGSAGSRGFLTVLLDPFFGEMTSSERDRTMLVACGPTGMLSALRALAKRHGTGAVFSMEQRMACGNGVCYGCVVPVRTDNGSKTVFKRVCRDGTWFDAATLGDRALEGGGVAAADRVCDAAGVVPAGKPGADADSEPGSGSTGKRSPRSAAVEIPSAEVDLSVVIHPRLALSNPVIMASGTFGYGLDYSMLWSPSQVGGFVTKAVTVEPRTGNPTPRIAEVTGGILNSIGLQNPGLEYFLDKILPRLRKVGTKVLVNISGVSVEEYATIAAALEKTGGAVHGVEVNVSCPNVKEGGALFGSSPEKTGGITAAVRAATGLPVLVKLTPAVADIAAVAKAAEKAGADAVCLINTLPAVAVDLDNNRPLLGNVFGGLSGPAIKPVALASLLKTVRAVDIPVVAGGGITTARDALEFLALGAAAVQVGTALFSNPDAPLDIIDGMRGYLASKGVSSIEAFRGSCLPPV